MSNKAIDWAVCQDIKAPAKCVLLVLANRANTELQCWPSHKTIGFESGFGETSVKRALRKLRDEGLISWKHRTDGQGGISSNLYSLILDPPSRDAPPLQRERTRPTTGFASTSRLWRSLPPARDADEPSGEPAFNRNETLPETSLSNIGKRTGRITKLKS